MIQKYKYATMTTPKDQALSAFLDLEELLNRWAKENWELDKLVPMDDIILIVFRKTLNDFK